MTVELRDYFPELKILETLQMSKLATVALVSLFVGCAQTSITPMTDMPKALPGCKVAVFSDRAAAEKSGLSEEICIVTTQYTSIAGALETAKKKICECGVNKAFIKSTSDNGNGWLMANVILVGFK